jgi:2-dehydro-3-deoxyphosphooctonate aldolase (KDO 8-P synthase)
MSSDPIVEINAARRIRIGNHLPLTLIAGPCALESRSMALEVAKELATISSELGIGVIFKGSFDKANRTSAASARGMGLDPALAVFQEVRQRFGLAALTDVHETCQCDRVAEAVDVLQIPAFLCRQTDLITAAARTGRAINLKKGQFLAPWDMRFAVEKVRSTGNHRALVTERGVSFGYNTLVCDMRALPILAETTQAPVMFDATHAVQHPGGVGPASGGERRFAPVLARAAVAIGVAALFVETHPDPQNAQSDRETMIPLRDLRPLVQELMSFDRLAKALRLRDA